MSADEPSPEDEKYLESLRDLLKISQEFDASNAKQNDEPEKTAVEVESAETRTDESEKSIDIPREQQLLPSERVEPLKSMVEPEYVKKVIRQMDTMTAEQLKQALMKIKVSTG